MDAQKEDRLVVLFLSVVVMMICNGGGSDKVLCCKTTLSTFTIMLYVCTRGWSFSEREKG